MTRPWGLEQQSAEYWEDKYWEAVRKTYLNQHPSELRQLRAQLFSLVELNMHLTDTNTCWHITGDTVYVDVSKLKTLILERQHGRQTERNYLALSESKYIKG